MLIFLLLYCYSFLSLFKVVCDPTTLKLVSPAKKTFMKLESLRMPFEYQMLTSWDMYERADENIENIKFFCVNGGHCFTYLSQSEQADYCRNI